MYGQRTMIEMLDHCKDIRQVAKPGAILSTSANPMAMNTWACNKYGGVRKRSAFAMASRVLTGRSLKLLRCGLNVKVSYEKIMRCIAGRLIILRLVSTIKPGSSRIVARQEYASTSWRSCLKTIRNIRRLKKFVSMCSSVLGTTAPNRTVISVNMCLGIANVREEIMRWIDLSSWINGETGGYLRVCTEGRNWFETDFPNWLAETPTHLYAGPA